ncbi:hypothetical protein [Oceanobacillus caeni]|uniref:hypothetical protein n=1 Tax=Oceanobacillus caeni TaxID=405946 RepID=UPI00362B494D
MKKIIVFLMILGVLSACGNASSQDAEQPNTDIKEETTTTQKDTEANKEEAETGMENNEVDNENTKKENNEISNEKTEVESDEVNYEEMAIWEEVIPTNNYSLRVVEDNNHKRIVLFEDENGHVSYKSIYIKDKDRLKVIDTNTDDGILYNDKI